MSETGVTPLAGVWIEIIGLSGTVVSCMSLPLRECGLKSLILMNVSKHINVTPLAGVWIEINKSRRDLCAFWSLPLRECGLKFIQSVNLIILFPSLPLRECGLKFRK